MIPLAPRFPPPAPPQDIIPIGALLELLRLFRFRKASQAIMAKQGPSIIALAGPNGAGKSTSGPALIWETFGVKEFVDADKIAREITPAAPEHAALKAGRRMLDRLHNLARHRNSFAFETTLSSRSFAPWITQLLKNGWEFHLVFLWLPSADLAVQRVGDRVRLGGHDVAEEVIRRRYKAGLRNFFEIYRPLAATWRIYDNSGGSPRLIATGQRRMDNAATDKATWERLIKEYRDG